MASLIDRIADLATGPLINGFGLGVRLMGPFFVMGFYFLLGLHVYSYFTVIIQILKKRLGTEFGLLWVAIGLAIAYNIAYNHFFATFLKPGSPKDLKNIETLRKELKKREGRKGFKNAQVSGHDHTHEFVDDDRFEDVSKDVKKLLRYRSKTISTLEQGWAKKCNACQYIKPIRTHHCSVCNQCVFLMDHHCPWVNNCLGLENYRYFLLFILYLLIGIVYNLITIVSVWNHHSYKQHNSMMSFITILDVALAIVLVGFNGWNWFLALSGMSTIEFWGSNGRAGMQKYDFNFKSIRDNLYKTFGTYNLVAILSPSLRNIPFSGIEWSYQMRDLGFNEKGERQAQDEETVIQQDEEEEKDLSEAKPRNRIDTTLDSLDKEILI